jgi:polysaccharide export outer membrane protein
MYPTIRPFLILSGVVAMTLFATAPVARAQSEAELRVGDSIEIKISGVPPQETSSFGAVNVGDDGTINLHLLGKVAAAGMTASQLQSDIEQRYVSAGIYTTPTIIITSQSSPRLINVSGAVRAEGRFSWTPDMTLLTAINAASGFNDFANQRRVMLTRGDSVQVYDVTKIRRDPTLDVPVKPGDTISVPQKLF